MIFDMRGDDLHFFIESRDDKHPGDWLRIADYFETPARVSDPRTGGAYGLRIEFTDERGREKTTVVSASAFFSHPRETCSMLSDLGMYIDREHQ